MASNSNSNYKAKSGSLKSPQTKKQTSTPKTSTSTCAPQTSTTYKQSYASTPTTQSNQQGKTPFQDRYDRNAANGLGLVDLIKNEKSKAGITNDDVQKKATNPAAVNYSSLNSSSFLSKNNDKSSNKNIVPINRGYETNSNISYKMSNFNSSYTKGNSVESLNVINKMKIDFSNIDLSMIAASASGASNGQYSRVNEDIWKNADLNITQREDGTFLVKNGDVPIGFTTEKGLNSLFTKNGSSIKNNSDSKISDSNDKIVNSSSVGEKLNLADLDLKRLSSSFEGAFNGNFTNLNLSAYNPSKLTYEVNNNGVVSIKNGSRIVGYTDVLGISNIKNNSLLNTNINSGKYGFVNYAINSDINASAYSMKNVSDKYTNETIQGAIDSFYSSNYDNIEMNTDNAKFLPYDFEKFLEEKGTSVDEFNNAIKAVVEKNGLGTREGVVAAVEALVKGLAQYDVKLPYISSIDADGSLGKYTDYGIDSSWGTNGSWYTSTYSWNNHHYNQIGLDCSGLVSWAIHNGGYKYLGYNSTGYHDNFPVYSSSDHKGQAGDLLWHSGHIMMIVGEDDGNYLVAEEGGGGEGLVITKKSFNTTDKVIDMTDFYSNPSNLDVEK